jgi:biopolymer transport protein ExbD
MAKIKVARKSTFIDMTAMCDVAFLLLTFFILTTKFRPTEVAEISIPASTAQIPVPDNNILLIQINKDGQVYMGVDDQNTRKRALSKIQSEFGVQFNQKQEDVFKLMDAFGLPIAQLPGLLSMSSDERAKTKQSGMSLDVVPPNQSEFMRLVEIYRFANEELRIEDGRPPEDRLKIAVKADKEADYELVNEVIAQLQFKKVNKFNLITSSRGAGEPSTAKE